MYYTFAIIFADDWQDLLEECLSHEVSTVKIKAAETHTEFFRKYYANLDSEDRNAVINRYLDNLQSNNQLVRIGFAQAIGNTLNIWILKRLDATFINLFQDIFLYSYFVKE